VTLLSTIAPALSFSLLLPALWLSGIKCVSTNRASQSIRTNLTCDVAVLD